MKTTTEAQRHREKTLCLCASVVSIFMEELLPRRRRRRGLELDGDRLVALELGRQEGIEETEVMRMRLFTAQPQALRTGARSRARILKKAMMTDGPETARMTEATPATARHNSMPRVASKSLATAWLNSPTAMPMADTDEARADKSRRIFNAHGLIHGDKIFCAFPRFEYGISRLAP
jgi:hypothetical protein